MPYKIEVPIPNNVHFTPRTLSGYIDCINKYKEHIRCLYFPLGHVDDNIDLWGIRAPQFVYQDGVRDTRAIVNWENALNEVFMYTGVPVKVLMNNIYSPAFYTESGWAKIVRKLNFYRSKFEVAAVTVADVNIIPKLRHLGIPVSLSTNSHNSLQELDMFLSMDELSNSESLHSICLQRDLNRNPKRLVQYLEKRPELMGKITLMVNEGCVNACIYKNSGDVEISMDDIHTGENKIHIQGCTAIARSEPWLFLTSQFLTKNILETYYPFISDIKLAGRNLATSQIKYMLQHYVDGADQELGKIMNVHPQNALNVSDLTSQYWFDVLSCNKECYTCKKCKQHYQTITDQKGKQ